MPGAKRKPGFLLLPPWWRLLLLASLLVLILGTLTWGDSTMEQHFLYFPTKTLALTPQAVGLDYEDIFFTAEDGTRLHGWFIPAAEAVPTVLFFHGNAGNIGDRVDNLLALHRFGLSVFIFDYRGYGQSAGVPSENGLYADGRAARNWLRDHKPEAAGNLFYFGRSLGAAAALQLALESPPRGLILESPFTSVAGMGKHHYPILYRLLGWLLNDKYDNNEKIKGLPVPLLLIYGTADTIVPPAMAQELFDLAPQPKQLHLIDGADHNDIFFLGRESYWDAWRQFLQKGKKGKAELP